MRAWILLGVVSLAVMAAIVAGCGGDTTTTVIQTTPPETTDATTTESTESTTPTEPTESTAPTETTESTTPTEPDAEGVVPDVLGNVTGEAKLALRGAGYKIFVNDGLNDVYRNGVQEIVCVQVPKAGAALEPGSQVKIIVRESCKAYGK